MAAQSTIGPKGAPLHRLLKRQLDRYAGGLRAISAEWYSLFQAINEAYEQSDEDRGMLERSLELSSRELLQANSELRTLFQALPDFFFRINSQGEILDQRGGDVEDLYATPARLLGKRLQDIPDRHVAEALDAAVKKVVRDRCLVSIEYPLRVGGNEQHYEVRLLPLPFDGEFIAIIRNITERVQTMHDLAEKTKANEELEQFAYIASHDLQEPLRTVQSYLQLLERRYKDKLDQNASEFIQFAVDGATRMRQLINDLLSYARVTSRQQPFVAVDVKGVFDEVLSSLAVAIEESGATITRGDLPVLMADRSQLVQLFQNLISNAIKFRGSSPLEVSANAERVNGHWRFAIRDNGLGLDPSYAERIFVIFQRLFGREEYPGTGIGLAICKKIVEHHSGRIWVESQAGQGATFYFTLIIEDEES
ncbi:MAG: PAS domain-containing protein [Deltaproteobacteria bacterium]|nr:PAS domain-containing protein [Deltaproteobacteria bacterium]